MQSVELVRAAVEGKWNNVTTTYEDGAGFCLISVSRTAGRRSLLARLLASSEEAAFCFVDNLGLVVLVNGSVRVTGRWVVNDGHFNVVCDGR